MKNILWYHVMIHVVNTIRFFIACYLWAMLSQFVNFDNFVVKIQCWDVVPLWTVSCGIFDAFVFVLGRAALPFSLKAFYWNKLWSTNEKILIGFSLNGKRYEDFIVILINSSVFLNKISHFSFDYWFLFFCSLIRLNSHTKKVSILIFLMNFHWLYQTIGFCVCCQNFWCITNNKMSMKKREHWINYHRYAQVSKSYLSKSMILFSFHCKSDMIQWFFLSFMKRFFWDIRFDHNSNCQFWSVFGCAMRNHDIEKSACDIFSQSGHVSNGYDNNDEKETLM